MKVRDEAVFQNLAIAFLALALLLFVLAGCTPPRWLGGPPAVPAAPASSGEVGPALVWIITISIFGLGGCVAAAIFLPVKKLATAGAAGFAAMIALALTVKAVLPFLPWVALTLGLIALALGIWRFRQYYLAMHAAIGYGCAVENAVTDADVAGIKERFGALQQAAGVKPIIDQALSKLKTSLTEKE